MVDAMIFIVVLGLAVSAISVYDNDDNIPNESSYISERIFSSKLKTSDVIDTDEAGLMSVPDLVAFYIITGESAIMEYIETLLRSFTQREDSYYLKLEYSNGLATIGQDRGSVISSSVKEYTVTYGGTVRVELTLC